MTGSARSYAASGASPGERIVSTYGAGPFVAAAALAAFDRALELSPGRSSALQGRARALAALGRRDEARRTWARLLETWKNADPDLPGLAEARAGSR